MFELFHELYRIIKSPPKQSNIQIRNGRIVCVDENDIVGIQAANLLDQKSKQFREAAASCAKSIRQSHN